MKSFLLVLSLSVPSVEAKAFTWKGPGISAVGSWTGSGTSSATFTVNIPLPEVRLNWWQRLALSNGQGFLSLRDSRLSWECPSGLPRRRLPGEVHVSLSSSSRSQDLYWNGHATWQGTVLHLSPDIRFPLQGQQALNMLDSRFVRMDITIPIANHDFTSCTAKLHATTTIEEDL